MIIANFIDVNRLYNFLISGRLDFGLFVIKFDAELRTQNLFLKIKTISTKMYPYH